MAIIPKGSAMAQYGVEAMKRGMTVNFEGKRYHVLGSWTSKAESTAWAEELRKVGFLVRVTPWKSVNKPQYRISVRRADGREYARDVKSGTYTLR